MPMNFSDTKGHRYRHGSVFLGLDDDGQSIGLDPETHLLTVASSGSGKGQGLLLPNSRKWAGNLLEIDPKGENVATTWRDREGMGQKVVAVDPYGYAAIPERLRGSFNPLATIDPESPTAREDLEVIADGIVVRSDPKHAQWDDGAAELIAGAAAWVISTTQNQPEHKNLTSVRRFLLQSEEDLRADAEQMAQLDDFGGLCQSAGLTILTALDDSESMEKAFLLGARRQTSWLSSKPIQHALATSTFDLSELKDGKVSLFLVLPPKYLARRSGFLRMFVRSAIEAMMGQEDGERCLFILDEFYSLGRIEEVPKSAAIMRSFGLHLWPFLQNIGQLRELYGHHGAETIMANCDAHIFFGNEQDQDALAMVSNRSGVVLADELVCGPPHTRVYDPFDTSLPVIDHKAHFRAREDTRMRDYDFTLKQLGKPRLLPDEVAALTGKGPNDTVARSMIVFLRGGDTFNLRLAPDFARGQMLPNDDEQRQHVKSFRAAPPVDYNPAPPVPAPQTESAFFYATTGAVLVVAFGCAWVGIVTSEPLGWFVGFVIIALGPALLALGCVVNDFKGKTGRIYRKSVDFKDRLSNKRRSIWHWLRT